MDEHAELVGRTIADRYRVEREVGQGGMATVYLAHDLKHDRQVAVKVLRPELAAVIGASRFLQEIKVTANLQHPHILGLIDSGTLNGTAYYVMPFVHGESLRDRITKEKQLSVADAVRIASEIAGALDYAHRQGIIHRDIKPENILVHDGQAMVLDFGIALAVTKSDAASRLTETGLSLGTPQYMSPEQAAGERDLDGRTNVYSLGCVLYEMLTGAAPFNAATAQAIVAKVLTVDAESISVTRRAVPANVVAAVEKAMSKLPADRFGTAAEFRAALATPEFGAKEARIAEASSYKALLRNQPFLIAAGVALFAFAVVIANWMRGIPGNEKPSAVIRYPLAVSSIVSFRLTPDGQRLLWLVRDSLVELSLADPNAVAVSRKLDGLTLDSAFNSPTIAAVSPNGAALLLTHGRIATVGSPARNRLLVVPVAGGSARILADSASTNADWNSDGNIYFITLRDSVYDVMRTTEAGNTASIGRFVARDSANLRGFQILPRARVMIVAMATSVIAARPASYWLEAVDLSSGKMHPLDQTISTSAAIRFVPPNILLFAGAGQVMAREFDFSSLSFKGPPKSLTPLIMNSNSIRGISITENVLAYQGNRLPQPQPPVGSYLVELRRNGEERRQLPGSTDTIARILSSVDVSPNGARLAYVTQGTGFSSQSGLSKLYTYSMPDGPAVATSRSATNYVNALFLGDGSRIVITTVSPNSWRPDSVFVIPAAGGGVQELIAAAGKDELVVALGTWPGDSVLVARGDSAAFVAPGGDVALEVYARDTAQRSWHLAYRPQVRAVPLPLPSRDGKWLAFTAPGASGARGASAETALYVQPLNAEQRRLIVSPAQSVVGWSWSGREIFYTVGDSIWSVSLNAQRTALVGKPKSLFPRIFSDVAAILPGDSLFIRFKRPLVPARGGRVAVAGDSVPLQVDRRIHIMINYDAELRRLFANKR